MNLRSTWLRAALWGLLVLGCGRQPVDPERSPAQGVAAFPANKPAAEPSLNVVSSRYGRLEVWTAPEVACTLKVNVERGTFGDGPPAESRATSDGHGVIVWSYPAPLIPAGVGWHRVSCAGSKETWADFAVPAERLDPANFTVRVEGVDPSTGLAGVTTRLEPSLVPLRDLVVRQLSVALEDEWRRATRGLGALRLVRSSADVAVYVLPGRGTSLNERSADGTIRVLIYAMDGASPLTPGKALSIALHELGHSWCCFGPGAGPDEHWLERIVDAQLVGVNRFGLMVHPVPCHDASGMEICATRFSERDLNAMGFAAVPPPVSDDCSMALRSLAAQVATLDTSIATSGAAIDSAKDGLNALVAEMKAIEARYPGAVGVPPEVRAVYAAAASHYERLYAETTALIAGYQDKIQAREDVARRSDALPC